jgi:TRAP-type transport system small permease protein
MTFLERATVAVALLLLVAMVFTTGAQVVSRYVLNLPLVWTEETGRHLMIWMVFLSSTVVYRRRQHIAIDLIGNRLRTARSRRGEHLRHAWCSHSSSS